MYTLDVGEKCMSKIDNLGRVVIPIGIRRALKLDSNSEIDIIMSKGSVIMTPSEKICKLCGCKVDANEKICLCQTCIKAVKQL